LNGSPKITVVDTSIAAKWVLHSEQDAQHARSLLQAHLREAVTLCAPSLLLWELANLMRYKASFTPSDADAAVQSVIDLRIWLIEPLPWLVRRAVSVAYQTGITAYDAAFVALALELECPFITADQRLADKIHSDNVRLLSQL